MLSAAGAGTGRARSGTAFGFSAAVHGALLAWVALATPLDPEPRKSVYDTEIKPHEDHLVWYHLQDKLPDISPAPATKARRPPRATVQFKQTLVAGTQDRPGDRQMIFSPAPEVPDPKAPPLPNMLAMAAPKPRLVAPPPQPLPEPPATPALDMDIPQYKPALPKAPLRSFTPPPSRKTAAKPATALPDAPEAANLAISVPEYKAALPPAPHKRFVPPPSKNATVPAVELPEAPSAGAISAGTPAYHAAVGRAPLRSFTPPTTRTARTAHDPTLPEAPSAGGVPTATPAYHAAVGRAPLRSFTPPPSKQPAAATHEDTLPDAPAAPAAPTGERSAALAVAGLDPAKLTDLPKPPPPRDAGFSAGPELRPKGGAEAPGETTGVVVPGLLARGGSAAIPTALPKPRGFDPLHPLDGVMPAPEPRATRVSGAPDPLFEGRAIYTMAIQMPNITSFSGSWMVWFAERSTVDNGKAEVEAPVPLRKVDPKYVATAVAERIEGKVRLSAIIRKDGHVDSVVLLRHLDPRLDETAEEALSKWIFQPARRGGVPIDVDAVFEIPFYLAPKPAR